MHCWKLSLKCSFFTHCSLFNLSLCYGFSYTKPSERKIQPLMTGQSCINIYRWIWSVGSDWAVNPYTWRHVKVQGQHCPRPLRVYQDQNAMGLWLWGHLSVSCRRRSFPQHIAECITESVQWLTWLWSQGSWRKLICPIMSVKDILTPLSKMLRKSSSLKTM